MQDARADLREIDAGLAACDQRLADPAVYNDAAQMEPVLAEQASLLDRYERAGGPAFEGRLRSMLNEIGLEERELELPTRVLSGGQRKLIGLAAAIVQDPQLLLLDEPEAHLDLEGRERLQGLMNGFAGGFLAVSHDRYLLDETVTAVGVTRRRHGAHVARQLHGLRGGARAGAEAAAADATWPSARRSSGWRRRPAGSSSGHGPCRPASPTSAS